MRFLSVCSVILLLTISTILNAQNLQLLDGREVNTVTSAVPLMRISPNARSGAMGETGVATTPDANSLHWNAAKFAFIEDDMGFAVSYTPWLRQLVDDIYLAYLSGYKKIDEDQTLAFSLRYFSLGNIQFTDINGQSTGEGNPNEFAIDGAYSRKLTPNLSASIAFRYIRSDLASGQVVNNSQINPASAIAADLGVYYTKDAQIGGLDGNYALGASISNVGSKINYTQSVEKDFIPMNLGLGSFVGVELDDYNKIGFALDVNKLLVPTPDTIDADNNSILDHKEKSVPEAIFSSFADAPGGFSEELREFTVSTGVEYWYDNQFAVRAGYFHEHATKGNRKYFTMGLGLRYNVFGLDFSYLVPVNGQQNPLNNTLRFTLLFNFDALKNTNDVEEGSRL